MDFDLRAHTHLLTLSGSRAYGIHEPESDVDLKGVAVPPARYLHGFLRRFEQADRPEQIRVFEGDLSAGEQAIARRTKLEGSVYDLRKFMRLAAEANPNVLDLLFCRDRELRLCTPIGERLRERRGLFLSAKARMTFAGYAASQLRRIKLHRRWLLNPPRREPTRADYDLPPQALIPPEQLAAAQAAIRARTAAWEIDFGALEPAEVLRIRGQIERTLGELMATTDARWRCAARAIGMDENLIYVLQKEREYKSARRQWEAYQRWRRHRNPARAATEAAFGFDLKHGAHLYRLLAMCREILERGEVHVWRGDRDAETIRAIRAGQWSYERLVAWAEAEERALEQIVRSGRCAVPAAPDREAIDRLCCELVERAIA